MADFLLPLPVQNPAYAASSPRPSNFKLPPLDGSLTLPQIYDWHLVHNPDHTCFLYEDGAGGYKHLTYKDIVPAADRAGYFVACGMGIDLNATAAELLPTVAVIASSDTTTHFCTVLGLIKAGIPFISISPHNSPAVIAHLVCTVDARHVLFSSEPSVVQVVETACGLVAGLDDSKSRRNLNLIQMPVFKDIFNGPHKRLKSRKYDLDSTVMYVHSSGSTALPKPLSWTHKFFLQAAVAPLFGDHNLCNATFAWHSASLSHGSGLHMLMFMPSTGMKIAVFPPSNPAIFPSPLVTFKAFENVKADYIISFPKLMETWAEDPDKVEVLKQATGVCYAGSPLNKRIGDELAAAGVNLFAVYGMSDAGMIGGMFPAPQGMDWEYMTITPHSGARFIEAGDGLHELIIVDQPLKRLTESLWNMKHEGSNAYGTRDLFMEHPTKRGYWRPSGRKDDRITHPSGKKTNPILMENILAVDLQVRTALVFGNGRHQTGALIQLEEEFIFDPSDEVKLNDFRTYIQPRIVEANMISPKHSELFLEMILVTKPNKPFKYTEKGSLMRAAVLLDYEQEVNGLYDAMEHRVLSDVKVPLTWSLPNALQFVQDVLVEEGFELGEDDNVFSHGCDSLRATRIEIMIRNVLKQVIKDSTAVNSLRNFAYDHPTPRELAGFVSDCVNSTCGRSRSQSSIDAMNQMIDRYTCDFPPRQPNLNGRKRASTARDTVVLLTGTTGGIGADLLAVLANDPSVSHVYAMNRGKNGVGVVERQKKALSARGLSPEIADARKVTLLCGDPTAKDLGLDAGTLSEMKTSVTHIFHIAWNVNWNLPLSAFEGMIQGLRNLIDFALSSELYAPPRLIFPSTIGVFRNIEPGFRALEQSVEDFELTVGEGYSESKIVAEKIIERATTKTPLKAVIVRLGQASGNRTGSWNVTDWFPAMIKSSLVLKSLPDVKGLASFVPSDIVARALNDMRNSDASVLHISHPRPVPLSSAILAPIADELGLPLVPYDKWLAALECYETRAVIADITEIPALKIMPFFRVGAKVELSSPDHAEILGLPTLSTDVSARHSESLACLAPLDSSEALLWLGYWRKVGFLGRS